MATAIPLNRATFTVEEIARVTGGSILRGGGESTGVSTDSRAVTPGGVFVAISGERFDAHEFLSAATLRGARTLVISKGGSDVAQTTAAVVKVDDTRAALGALARAHREKWSASPHPHGERRLVAITGSAGKTTTRTVLARVLAVTSGDGVHASLGNLNNEIGVPMTLLGLTDEHRFAVIEIGTSAGGEIAKLAALALPDAAVLTLVAAAHTQGIGSIDDVALEKGALFAALSREGVAIANADDPRALAQLARSPSQQHVTYGFSATADYRIRARRPRGLLGSGLILERAGEMLECASPLLGDSGALAVAASLAVVERLLGRKVTAAELTSAIASLTEGGEGRLSPVVLADGTWVLDDSYNANPASMRSSVKTAAELAIQEKRRLVLVLGEMRELGDLSPEEHSEIGRLSASVSPALLVGVGGEAMRIVEEAKEAGLSAFFAEDSERATPIVLERTTPGDLVLVKGSRSIATERIVRALAERGGSGSGPGSGPGTTRR